MRFERALDISQYHDNDLKNTNILNYIKKKNTSPRALGSCTKFSYLYWLHINTWQCR